MKITGLILAAGLSGRMGKFKPLVTYKGKTFIQNIALKLNSVCYKLIIVTGYKADEVEDNINRLKLSPKIEFVFNQDYKNGMFTSLQAGLKATKSSDWILYHFVDQPGLPEKFYTEFTNQIDSNFNWIQPSFNKQSGHPILMHQSILDLIISASAKSSLREISKDPTVKKTLWKCEFNEVLQDVDTESDLSELE